MSLEVKREMIEWAIARSRRSRQSLIEKSTWIETSDSVLRPTLGQLEKFAKEVRVPLGFLFLNEPPKESLPLPDFRTMAGGHKQPPSPDLLDTIYACQNRQSWYKDYAVRHDIESPKFVGSIKVDTDISEAAGRIRDYLEFAFEQRSANTWTEALAELIRRADDTGVLVMVSGIVGSNTTRSLDPEEFRGFAISDKIAPLIFVNGADTKSAQMFTIIHELAHIWAGQSAVTDASPDSKSSRIIERWCDAVAGEVLVPRNVLEKNLKRDESITESMERLAKVFKVSTLVILRRLWDLERFNSTTFWSVYEDELKRLKSLAKKSTGGDFYRTQNYRVSRTFARALLQSTFEGETLYGEAMRLLAVSSSKTLEEYAERLGVG